MSEQYEKIKPKCKLNELELKPELQNFVKEIMEDRDFAHALEKEGLIPRKRILLWGPPGCGKTSIAHAIAAETGLPLYAANSAQIQDAYVGRCEKNLENVFRFAETNECVFLMDEFDSFSRDRSSARSWEKDQVNTVLVNLENRIPKGLFIACTNLKDDLDEAVLRRFDAVMEVPLLTFDQMLKIAKAVLKDRFSISPEECVIEGKTPSGTVRAATNKMRSAVLASERINPTPKPAPVSAPTVSVPASAGSSLGDVSNEDAELFSRLSSSFPSFPYQVPGGGGGGGGGAFRSSKARKKQDPKSITLKVKSL